MIASIRTPRVTVTAIAISAQKIRYTAYIVFVTRWRMRSTSSEVTERVFVKLLRVTLRQACRPRRVFFDKRLC